MTTTVARTGQLTGRVALIGAGGIGRAHAEAAAGLTGATLVAVADVDAAAARSVAKEYEADVVAPEALADPGAFDLVVVASPPVTHPNLVEPLLRAGVPVLCEKPIAVDLAAAQRLAQVVRETGTPLSMATKFRFVDDVVQSRMMIAAGTLGEILKVEVSFAGWAEMGNRWNSDPAVAGGGVLIDNATHGVDLVRYLVGDISSVLVVTGPSVQDLRVEDSATLLARTVSGALAQVDVTWSFRRLSPTYCSIYGSHGSIEIAWGGSTAYTRTAEPYRFGSGYQKIASLRSNLEAVLQANAIGAAPPTTIADAVAAAAAIDAGYASAAVGRWLPVEGTP